MRREHLYGLVDVDAMYASCEQAVQPWLQGRPVVVLSNNDGCVIARTAEAKALGIERGQPWLSLARNPRMREVVARSANFELYGDFSTRLLSIVETYTPWVQPYSIDECYLALPAAQASHQARRLRQQVHEWLGLPLSIGLGPSRTLAHLATKQAKATGHGVGNLAEYTPSQQQAVLANTPVEAIWGVAERLAARLAPHGITTAADLARVDPGWARRAFSVDLERTIRELRGMSCIPLDQDPPPRQQCLYTRQLGQPVTAQDTLAEIASTFAQALARRLRRHQRAAGTLTVQLSSGGAAPRIGVQATHTLPAPTAATIPLATTAAELARRLWRAGYAYRRVGLLAHELTTWPPPLPLEADIAANQDEALAQALETITARYGPASIGLGHAGLRHRPSWHPRQRYLWPLSTVRWNQLPLAHC